MNYFEAECFKREDSYFMWLKLSGASDHHPQLWQISWKINCIWTIEQGTMGQYEKHESGILGQRAESIYKNKIKGKKRKG